MAEKLGLSNEVKEIKLGKSFMRGEHPSFHTFRYDFMPASLDTSKRATVDIGEGHQVTVTVPHIEGSGTANTVFKGSKKPYQKECVLIIDHNTGEITLEKLSCNVQLKKTRAEGSSKMRSNTPIDQSFISRKSPSTLKLSPQQKPHSTSFGRSSPVPKCSPLPKSPLGNQPSPGNSTNPSMPSLSMLGPKPIPETSIGIIPNPEEPEIGVLSHSSSSDSSSSGESSDSSSSDNEEQTEPKAASNTLSMPSASNTLSMPSASNTLSMPSASNTLSMPSASNTLSMPSASNSSFNWTETPSASFSMPTANSLPSMPTANSLPSMPKFSLLSEDLKLSESDSDSDS